MILWCITLPGILTISSVSWLVHILSLVPATAFTYWKLLELGSICLSAELSGFLVYQLHIEGNVLSLPLHREFCRFIWLVHQLMNTYKTVYIKTFKIALTCFDQEIIIRQLRCSLLKLYCSKHSLIDFPISIWWCGSMSCCAGSVCKSVPLATHDLRNTIICHDFKLI
jgi:hypothetical protein